MRPRLASVVVAASLAGLAVAGCGGDDDSTGDGTTDTGTGAAAAAIAIDAPTAAITVDGDAADWGSIAGADLNLEAIAKEEGEIEEKQATLRVAHDDEFVYTLLEVQDDYNWNATDPHLSASSAVMWLIDPAAGAHMGAEDPSGTPGVGMVDLWHWETECAAGKESGGSVSGPGAGEDPGNDSACNYDDEWANSAFEREDDNGTGAENSLLGVWNHTNPVADGAGTWVFESRRPLQTGDEQDAQFSAGDTVSAAVAYWDPDNTPKGWEGDEHVQSSNQGWIEVTMAE